LYLSNGSTDRREIWQDNTSWPYESYRPLKFRIFRPNCSKS